MGAHSHASGGATKPRVLPRGWKDLVRQISIWLGFIFGYELVSSFAGHRSAEALANARRVVRVENTVARHLIEVTLQQLMASSRVLSDLAVWTYWNSEFTAMGLALLW